METIILVVGILVGSGGVGTMIIAILQGRARRREGATGKIVTEVESRRRYVEGVYEDYDWEARQRRYWEQAYRTLEGWAYRLLARVQGLLENPPEVPPLPPFPERPPRDRDKEREDANDAGA